ncbi:MAG: FadR family transcriptional regulator [Anaerohalosphaera sp.]|nr:FadR family transcriptional regulator [Anaerohalosphaera sp.]
MKISPIEKRSLVDMAESKVRRAIVDSGLKVGDVLPGEMELAERLGVSRNVMREALSRLRMLGVLESRKRRGMVLTEPDLLGGIAKVLDLPVLGDRAKHDLFELRLVVELGISDLIFLRKTDSDMLLLKRIVIREESMAKGTIVPVECEVSFHTQLYRMAGNETLRRFQSLLEPFFNWESEYDKELGNHPDDGTVTHRQLFEILSSGTVEQFRAAIQKHLQPHIDKINNIRLSEESL